MLVGEREREYVGMVECKRECERERDRDKIYYMINHSGRAVCLNCINKGVCVCVCVCVCVSVCLYIQ